MRFSVLGVVLAVLYCVTLALVAVFLAQGWSFYWTPLVERAHHEGYWLWKSGGRLGHRLGLAGTAMMVLMLSYSARKRLRALRHWGPVSRWLDVHIYLGVSGPLLVVLHSAFKVHGLVALSFWSMVAVALSGVAGRYLYLQIPRTRAGDEIALEALRRRDSLLTERLQTQFGLDPERLARLDRAASLGGSRPTLTRLLLDMLFGAAREWHEVRRLVSECRGRVPPRLLHQLGQIAREKTVTHRRILMWDRAHELFHYWHVLHKPFAVVMYLLMVVHVGVALMTGYGW